jgi:hypothetical protein
MKHMITYTNEVYMTVVNERGKFMVDNKALLSQCEVDTLVNFLLEQKNGLQGAVLTQESIDKLVLLLSNEDINLLKFDINTNVPGTETDELISNLIQYDKALTYELCCGINNNRIELIAINKESKISLRVTPKCLETMSIVNDNSNWGSCIEPILFDKIASIFHFKYTKATLESVNRLFASKMYGSEDYVLPTIYLPSTASVLQNLLLLK